VIQRNILENPGWYTAYTPYQAEIAQGRLEALLNFQTMIVDLTGMEIANASLLDEATAAAEAMHMLHGLRSRDDVDGGKNSFFVSHECFPQTIELLKTRAKPLGIDLVIGDFKTVTLNDKLYGALLQYPAANGVVHDYADFVARAKANGMTIAVAADILSLVLLTPPGEWVRTWCWVRPSVSACRWATEARTRRSSPAATRTSARCGSYHRRVGGC